MNKKIIRVISFVMALMLAFGVLAFAAEGEEKSVMSFEKNATEFSIDSAVIPGVITVAESNTETSGTYKVIFVADGVVETKTVNENESLATTSFPEVPAKEGFIGEWNVTEDITSSATVVAVYSKVIPTDSPVATATMKNKTVKAGEEFELIVSLANCDAVKSLQLSNFNFGEDITVVSGTPLVQGAMLSDWSNGKLTVAFASNSVCNGDALKLVLKVADNATPGVVTATFDAEVKTKAVREDEVSEMDRSEDSILLKINTSLAMAYGEMVEIDNTNVSVVPYIVNGRTLVPLRFVSETLGAEVVWEDGWDYCFVKKNEKEIKITFGSADIEVDGEVITYDAPIQVVENRTMVPIRFISETLGYDVYWNEPNQIVAITPMDNPWVRDREAELSTINSMMVTLLLKRKL